MTAATATTARAHYRETPAVLDVEERLESVGARLPAGFVRAAVAAVREFAETGREFTARDLARALPAPDHPAHLGGLVAHLHARHVIKPAGLTLARASDGCERPLRTWAADRLPEDDAAAGAPAAAA